MLKLTIALFCCSLFGCSSDEAEEPADLRIQELCEGFCDAAVPCEGSDRCLENCLAAPRWDVAVCREAAEQDFECRSTMTCEEFGEWRAAWTNPPAEGIQSLPCGQENWQLGQCLALARSGVLQEL